MWSFNTLLFYQNNFLRIMRSNNTKNKKNLTRQFSLFKVLYYKKEWEMLVNNSLKNGEESKKWSKVRLMKFIFRVIILRVLLLLYMRCKKFSCFFHEFWQNKMDNTLREKILAGRNFGEWAHSPILVQFGGIYFGDLIKVLNLARIYFGERPIFWWII